MGVDILAAGKKVGNTVVESVVDNAVVTKEFRTRMRGWKPYVVMGGYVLLLVIVMAIGFWNIAGTEFASGQFSPLVDRKIGMMLFSVLTVTQVVLLTLVLPSLTASSVTQEIERKTIDMLALSKLTAGKVVVGKHLSGFLYAMVLLVSSIPLAGLCLMFGGISPAEVALTYVSITAWAFLFTSVGVMFSSMALRSAAASLSSYGVCVGYMLLSLVFAAGIMMSGMHGGSSTDYSAFTLMNPAFAPMAALNYANVSGVHIPLVVISSVLQVGFGILMLLVASTHIRYQNAERALPIRLLLLVLSAAIIWLLHTDAWNSSAVLDQLAALSIFALVVVCLFSAGFTTGRIRVAPGSLVLPYALSIRRMFRSDVGGGALFSVLWITVCHAASGLAIFWTATAEHTMLKSDFWSAYWKIGIAMPAVVLGVSALGVMFSSFASRRRNALAFGIVSVVLLFLGYMFMLIGHDYSGRLQAVWQVAALWPPMSIIAAIGVWEEPLIVYEQVAWAVTAAVYALITVGALVLAGRFHSRGMGVQEEE